ncbi:hypothetical protein WJX75_002134 [Coccomyxa subellipsoidea]|uniref:L domain-like protein n=1 Tax=Coccomyxa subellipsoidea TaxID=248742 RepID=A0ABR2YJ37_9CHLO
MPVAQVRGAIAHAASQGCAAAILREFKAACSKRDEEAATNLMEGAAAEPFIGASFQAAFNRATSLGLDAACAAATTLIAPRREDMSKRLATQALTSTAAQLTGLESCSRLQVLNVSNNALASIKGIARLTSLRELDLSVNAVTSLGGLQCCSELERLNVDDNKLCCVEGNLPITALTWLSLANNALTSIEGIPGCSMLGHLSVQGNKITSLSGLQACTRLCHLDVGLNKLTAFPSSSLSLDSLRHIVLNGNRYLEERCRLLPQLEKEHSHARVPHEELEERMTNHLSASSFTPLALLQWQLSGRGSPFSLGQMGVMRGVRSVSREQLSIVMSRAGRRAQSQAPDDIYPARVLQHNNLARRHWILSQVQITPH